MKKKLLIFFLVLMIISCTESQYPKKIKRIRSFCCKQQPSIENIFSWKNYVIVKTNKYNAKFFYQDVKLIKNHWGLPMRKLLGFQHLEVKNWYETDTVGDKIKYHQIMDLKPVKNTLLLLLRKDKEYILNIKENSGWEWKPILFFNQEEAKKPPELLTYKDQFLIVYQNKYYYSLLKTWQQFNNLSIESRSHCTFSLFNNLLFIAEDLRDWGGDLGVIDIKKNAVVYPFQNKLGYGPIVNSGKMNRNGEIWLVSGSEHRISINGGILLWKGSKLNKITEFEGSINALAIKREVIKGYSDYLDDDFVINSKKNWSLMPSILVDILFDKNNAPLFLAKNFGIVKYDGNTFQYLNNSWPHETNATTFAWLDSDNIAIGTERSGILIFNMKTQQFLQVKLLQGWQGN